MYIVYTKYIVICVNKFYRTGLKCSKKLKTVFLDKSADSSFFAGEVDSCSSALSGPVQPGMGIFAMMATIGAVPVPLPIEKGRYG